MNHNYPTYVMSSPRSHDDEWNPGDHPQPFAYPVSMAAHNNFYTASPALDAFGHPSYVPTLPFPSTGRGASTNPEAYHFHSNSLSPFSFTTPEMTASTWQTSPGVSSPAWASATGATYDPSYVDQYGDEASSPGSSDSRGVSPSSENNAALPGTKERKFACTCVSVTSPDKICTKAFVRKADLQRHESCVHDKHKSERFNCTYKKCQRKGTNGFKRKDHLTEHMRHFHHKDIPKRQRRADVEGSGEEEMEDEAQVVHQQRYQGYFQQ